MIGLPNAVSLKLIAGIACALLLALLIYDRNRWKATATLRQQQVVAAKAAHDATVANYRAAADRARRADAANAARVEGEQAAINERTSYDYESRLAAARASAGRLRPPAGAQADPRRGGAAPVPGLSAAAKGAAQAAGEERLPDSDALIATEQAIQLDELIKWIRAQQAIDIEGSAD
jgi:hypothetical protein